MSFRFNYSINTFEMSRWQLIARGGGGGLSRKMRMATHVKGGCWVVCVGASIKLGTSNLNGARLSAQRERNPLLTLPRARKSRVKCALVCGTAELITHMAARAHTQKHTPTSSDME